MFFTKIGGFIIYVCNKLHKTEIKSITEKTRPILFKVFINTLPL